MRGLRRWFRLFAGVLVLVALAAALAFPEAAISAAQLPLFALFSVSRMVVAYLLSLVFAVVYGHTAATNKRAAVVMLPLLDILQSIPILAFAPAAIFFFVDTFNHSSVGSEIAVVFLIFTSMAWNMAFGVYESLTTIPQDLEAAATSFGLSGWLRFRMLAFPAAIPKLIYNSILSWTNGWFFLVASEVFESAVGGFSVSGLGAFIGYAGQAGDAASIALGLGVLAAVVLTLDILVWRPLSVWSERFRMETAAGREIPRVPSPYERFRWLPKFPRTRRQIIARTRPLLDAYHRVSFRLDVAYTAHPKVVRDVRRIDLAMFLVVFIVVVGTGIIGLTRLFLQPLPANAALLPIAAVSSFSRLALAYVVAVAWTVPLAVVLGRSDRASRFLTPVLEIFASIPATALLPVIVGFSLLVTTSFGVAAQLAAVLIALFSMQWYLLFNIVAGVRSIPDDLQDAARSFGLRGVTYWRRVLLPAIVPSLLTGSITAWGAGWNALIVAEFVQYARKTYEVEGLGSLINQTVLAADNEMLFLTILTMVFVVLAMNKLLWRPLFKRASIRFRLEV